MTDNELKALISSLAIAQKETNQQLKQTDEQIKKTDQQLKQTDKQLKQTDKQVNELGKQIGGLGRKFGIFTEGLALPSMQKLLHDRFHMEVISPSVRVSKNGKEAKIDVLAYANSEINEVYVVEVKSHLREEGIRQLQDLLDHFRMLFPEHADKKVFGILAAVDMSKEMRARVLMQGFYAAHIREDIFSLDVPDDFEAKAF